MTTNENTKDTFRLSTEEAHTIAPMLGVLGLMNEDNTAYGMLFARLTYYKKADLPFDLISPECVMLLQVFEEYSAYGDLRERVVAWLKENDEVFAMLPEDLYTSTPTISHTTA